MLNYLFPMKINYVFRNIICSFFIASGILIKAQAGFVWVKGPSVAAQTGSYGILNTTNIGNNPGARQGSVSWKDASGNFWMFGGYGFDHIGNQGYLNDVWRYTPSGNTWTWKKGDDVIAQLGVYGTLGVGTPTNKPGSRSTCVSWTDASGNLYLFGGFGYDKNGLLGYLNDLWVYNLTSNQWTWLSGSNVCYQPGVYGTLNTAAPGNVPGARYGATAWSDTNGNLWMFGGFGITTNTAVSAYLNDLWKYDLASSQWTWMGGSNAGNQNGAYGSQSVSSPTNVPGSRKFCMPWQDGTGNFYLFGGEGYDAATTSTTGLLNDLWKYNVNTGLWTWLNGSNTMNQNGTYGTLTVPAASNTPGGRSEALTWLDAAGSCWMGFGYGLGATTSSLGDLNDLWRFDASLNQWMWMGGSGSLNFPGIYGSIGNPSPTNIPGARRSSAQWIDSGNNLWIFGGYGKAATGPADDLSDLWKYTNCYVSPITLSVTSSDSLVCDGEVAVLTVSGSNNYTWSNGSNNQSISVTPSVTTSYTVTTTNSNTCLYSASFTQSISACTGIKSLLVEKSLQVFPNPSNGVITVAGDSGQSLIITDNFGRCVFKSALTGGETIINSGLEPGVYFYVIENNGHFSGKGKLVITH